VSPFLVSCYRSYVNTCFESRRGLHVPSGVPVKSTLDTRRGRLDKARVAGTIQKVVVANVVGDARAVDWALKVGGANALRADLGESSTASAFAIVKATVARATWDANRVGWTLKVASSSGSGTGRAPPTTATLLTIVGAQVAPRSALDLTIACGRCTSTGRAPIAVSATRGC
jgi:hypothetical protein